MDDALMVAYEAGEKKIGFAGMLRLIFLRPRAFFKETVARDKFPYLTFSAWLVGLAHALQWMDKFLLTPGGLVSGRVSSFALLMIMSFVFMGVFYLIGGALFHFYSYLADSRKDMKNSMAVAVYAWMPFVVVVFLTKFVALILLGQSYVNPPEGWWFQMPSMALIGISVLYGWFLALYGACSALGCKKLRGFLMLFVAPILWFVFLAVFFKYLGWF
jgi:hypothetical protein